MEESETNKDFANNPFIALFDNVVTAQGFAEGTKFGMETREQPQVDSNDKNSEVTMEDINNEDDDNTRTPSKTVTMEDKNNKDDDNTPSPSKTFPAFKKEILVNDFLERIFLFTIEFNPDNFGILQFGGVPSVSIKLNELKTECEENGKPCLLSSENINQALYERLQIRDAQNSVLIRAGHSGDLKLDSSCETHLIRYLSSCYCRINTEDSSIQYVSSSTSIKCSIPEKEDFEKELHEVAENCLKLVVSFTGTVLLQPEIFPVSNPHAELFDVLTSAYAEPHLYEYVCKLIESHTDGEDLSTMFTPVLDLMWKSSEQFELLHPNVFPLLNVLIIFSRNSHLSWCLLKSKYWLPSVTVRHDGTFRNRLGSSFEYETILGRFLRITSIPQHNMQSRHFMKPSQQNESDMNAITDNIRQYLDTLVTMIHKILHNLMRLPDMQHEILSWIGLCLNSNAKRSQMYTDPAAVAGSGFFLNLTQVLLKFCEPFCSPNSKLLLKVDCRYCAVSSTSESIIKSVTPVHAIGLDKYTPMVPKPDEMPPIKVDNEKFNFISEIFFLTHLCYKLGFVKMYEQYEEIMKRLRKLSNVYQDALRQGGMHGDVENFKNDFEDGIRTQLAIKAHISSPTLSDLALKFSISSGHWLVQLALSGDEYVLSKHRELDPDLLSAKVSPASTVIPEFIGENVGDTMRSLGNFSEESLERCDQLRYVMNFFAVFLGEKCRIQNPHLRAKLAECLAAFLPKDKSRPSGNTHFSFSYRKKAFEISSVMIKILPQSLLQLFVDIEFTGHTMEFDQKFMYRRYMYAILEYIWQIPSYQTVFKDLFAHSKKMYKEEKNLSTFPRFINLLVNDSTFLLDEALQNLVTIKGLQGEKANGEWENLPEQEKSDKEKNLTQCGHMAEGYNTMAKETVHVICYITKEIDRPFVSHIMADSMAQVLNYFFVHLVGPKRKQLKVNDFEKYNFDPGYLVKNITKIYLQLGKHDDFCQAIVKDTRSYSAALFKSAVEVLQRLEGAYEMADELENLSVRLEEWRAKISIAEDKMPEPPEEFIDPISCELMQEPVKLPSSGKIVCRSTIAKHLLSDEKDPFNRSPLQLDQVIPCEELSQKIRDWMRENFIEPPLFSSD